MTAKHFSVMSWKWAFIKKKKEEKIYRASYKRCSDNSENNQLVTFMNILDHNR